MIREDGEKYIVAVAGIGYVGLSMAVLLAQHNTVTAVDVVSDKIEQLNKRISPIADEYIENTWRNRSWI